MHPTGLRAGAALACARLDQLPLKLRNACKHRDQQSAMRRRGVRPSVSQRLEANRAFAKGMQDVEQVAMASRSSRVTISTSPGSSRRRSFASSGAVSSHRSASPYTLAQPAAPPEKAAQRFSLSDLHRRLLLEERL